MIQVQATVFAEHAYGEIQFVWGNREIHSLIEKRARDICDRYTFII